MTEPSIRELQVEVKYLRDLVAFLSIRLLRKRALGWQENRSSAITDPDRLLREAEKCFRCAKVPGLKGEIAEGLNAAGHELMARAVAIDTDFQRGNDRLPRK